MGWRDRTRRTTGEKIWIGLRFERGWRLNWRGLRRWGWLGRPARRGPNGRTFCGRRRRRRVRWFTRSYGLKTVTAASSSGCLLCRGRAKPGGFGLRRKLRSPAAGFGQGGPGHVHGILGALAHKFYALFGSLREEGGGCFAEGRQLRAWAFQAPYAFILPVVQALCAGGWREWRQAIAQRSRMPIRFDMSARTEGFMRRLEVCSVIRYCVVGSVRLVLRWLLMFSYQDLPSVAAENRESPAARNGG